MRAAASDRAMARGGARYATRAPGYKPGQLDIPTLRERLDIRAFHDQILGGGAMPLTLLDRRIAAGIGQVKAGPSATLEKPQ